MDARHYQIRQQFSALLERAGQTATWRSYVSASAGQPEYGIGPGPRYVQRTITGVFEPLSVREVNVPGGQFGFGDTMVTTMQPLGAQDELDWNGQRWKVASEAARYSLWATAMFRSVITRA